VFGGHDVKLGSIWSPATDVGEGKAVRGVAGRNASFVRPERVVREEKATGRIVEVTTTDMVAQGLGNPIDVFA
jgi:hypothetical protein